MAPVLRPPWLDPRASVAPSARVLSNGTLTTLVTAAGTGSTSFDGHALTRWRADRVEDLDGLFLYLRDLQSDAFWSVGHQPVQRPAPSYRVTWEPGKLTFSREDDGIESVLEISVAPAAPFEMRRLRLANRSGRFRRIEATSYAEVVLADPAAHAAHPAFSKLFVQTERPLASHALLVRRRPRAAGERHPWLMHALVGGAAVEHETDRTRFLGRGGSLASPAALRHAAALSGTCGNVLDPMVSLRCAFDLAPGEEAKVTFLLGAAADRGMALGALAALADATAVERAFAAASAAARALLDRLSLEARAAEYLQALAGAVLYGHPQLRAARQVLLNARPSRPDLERLGVAPGRALVVLHAERTAGAALLPDLLRGVRYWRSLALPIDLLVLRGPEPLPAGEVEPARTLDVRVAAPADIDRLDAWARWVVTDALPDLRASAGPPGQDGLPASAPRTPARSVSRAERPSPLEHGFSPDGREYSLRLHGDGTSLAGLPPQPWTNVVANEGFGFIVSETGAGATWCGNSRERRLTPWANDPLLDPHGEALYLRDEDTGHFWSPLPGPAPADGGYEVRHGLGWSGCRHESHGLEQETLLFVPRADPVKIAVVRVRNAGTAERRVSIVAYRQLVLGGLPGESGRFVGTEPDPESGAVLAQSTFADDYAGSVVFGAVLPPACAIAVHTSGDRATFLGRNGTPARPLALCRQGVLDGRTGAGLDPCIAQQVVLVLAPGETVETSFLLGEERDPGAARALVARYRTPGAVERALREVRAFWEGVVGGVQIATPSPAIDLMMNGWLPYQTLACRIWARSALYQSGGAFGFRDQLQDAAALLPLLPECTRQQLLLHAAHQFVEGDVLHWWHPPAARGLRTRFADDLLWLPYLTAHYVRVTGDWGILEEKVRFLAARGLVPGEDEAYLLPEDSGTSADLYEHCCRALDRSLTRGPHGLPLFGSGDWNDGMNRVGREGRGESVWMGFFLYSVLGDFAPICERRGDGARLRRYAAHRGDLSRALEDAGWDGGWYRRGYYDNGAPLGSWQSDECRIDALVQAWAVLSGAAPPERAAQAMEAVERHLVSEADGLIRLLTPPFENGAQDPGYIRGYVPGVRENGGQYTHAALWVVRAFAELGRNDRVAKFLEMLTPVHHANSAAGVAVYQVEPYVVAADVYGAPPHVGRGGWTWYTGSSGWMYRVALESLLGLRVEAGEFLTIAPCVPDEWPGFSIHHNLPGETTSYEIVARNPHRSGLGVRSAALDGVPVLVESGAARVPLRHDGLAHRVEVVLGRDGRRSGAAP